MQRNLTRNATPNVTQVESGSICTSTELALQHNLTHKSHRAQTPTTETDAAQQMKLIAMQRRGQHRIKNGASATRLSPPLGKPTHSSWKGPRLPRPHTRRRTPLKGMVCVCVSESSGCVRRRACARARLCVCVLVCVCVCHVCVCVSLTRISDTTQLRLGACKARVSDGHAWTERRTGSVPSPFDHGSSSD